MGASKDTDAGGCRQRPGRRHCRPARRPTKFRLLVCIYQEPAIGELHTFFDLFRILNSSSIMPSTSNGAWGSMPLQNSSQDFGFHYRLGTMSVILEVRIMHLFVASPSE